MTKVEFTKLIADKAEMTQKDAAAFLGAYEEIMMEEIIAKEDEVRLKFGTIGGKTKVTNDRMCRNPKDGSQVFVKGKTTTGYPFVRWSKAARE